MRINRKELIGDVTGRWMTDDQFLTLANAGCILYEEVHGVLPSLIGIGCHRWNALQMSHIDVVKAPSSTSLSDKAERCSIGLYLLWSPPHSNNPDYMLFLHPNNLFMISLEDLEHDAVYEGRLNIMRDIAYRLSCRLLFDMEKIYVYLTGEDIPVFIAHFAYENILRYIGDEDSFSSFIYRAINGSLRMHLQKKAVRQK